MMINDYIKQIVELDNKTESEVKQINDEVKMIEETADLSIKTKENEVVQEVTESCKRDYEQKVAEALVEKDKLLEKTDIEVQNTIERFEAIKFEAAKSVIKFLLKNPNA